MAQANKDYNCPVCEGDGVVWDRTQNVAYLVDPPIYECDACEGEGVVDEKQLGAIENEPTPEEIREIKGCRKLHELRDEGREHEIFPRIRK